MSRPEGRIGLNVSRRPARQAIDLIKRAEAAGVPTAWMTMSATGMDTLTLFAAAAAQTSRISLGTAIVPAFTRHPLGMATQAITLHELAPNRIRLGIGTSHGPQAEAYGLPFGHPLDQLGEYLDVLRPALRGEKVTFAGDYYHVHGKLVQPAPVPVLVSALRENAFRLAGEKSDGAISWLVPPRYLIEKSKPALEAGAQSANRATPPLIAHTIVAFEGPGRDRAAIRADARKVISGYAELPFYQRMFAASGLPVSGSIASDALIDALVHSGGEDTVGAALLGLLGRLDPVDELLVMLLPGADQDADESRLVQLIGRLAGSGV